jgi:hypothetical protein
MPTIRARKPRSKRFVDHTDERIGTLTAIAFAGFQGPFPKWRCRCDCGRIRTIRASRFGKSGAYRVCRCNPRTKDDYIYDQWRIRVRDDCRPEWKDFNTFRDSVGHRPKGRFLSKRRLSEPWSPRNFSWVRRLRKLEAALYEFNGKKQTAHEWCKELKISRQRFHQRMRSGLPKHLKFAPRGGIGRPTVFDWTSVADGKRHCLIQGKHFDCDPKSLPHSLNYWARKNKARVSINTQPRHVFVRINRPARGG